MLALMFNQRFKNMRLVTTFLGHENAIAIVFEYDQNFLLPLLTKVTKLLMRANVKKTKDL
jgi:hypothetical protein